MSTPPLPTFLIIGAQKSGTRWLRTRLGQQPGVFTAPGEPMYFSNPARVAEEGPARYLESFEGWDGEPVVGEATPSYMVFHRRPPAVAQRILDLLGDDVRLIAILRDPVDRAQSAVAHHLRSGALPEGTILESHARDVDPRKDRLGIIASGWYATCLDPYVEHFGDGLLVLLHDDLSTDPGGLYRAACTHIGADPTFVPEGLERPVHVGQPGGSEVAPDLRRELWDTQYRDEVARLEAMTGRDLSRWAP